jgi:glutamate racemase
MGVFDSGLGGLSVLKALRAAAPWLPIEYVADSAHAPYGERDESHVLARSRAITAFLRERGARVVVVACNTATAAAVNDLRARHPDLPVVGVEPGVKPAVALSPRGRIGVLATSGTLGSERFRALLQRHAGTADLVLQACPGLARAIEGGRLDAPEILALVEQHVAPLRAAGVDTVVLGCTHYPFVADHIQAALGPAVRLVDTADAVARRALALWPAGVIDPAAATAPVTLWSSGDPALLTQAARLWLGLEGQAHAWQEAPTTAQRT